MILRGKVLVFCLLLSLINPLLKSQNRERKGFENQYRIAIQVIKNTCDTLENLTSRMKAEEPLTDLQQARINLIISKLQILNEIESVNPPYSVIADDTLTNVNSLVDKAQNFIVQSRPDEGIPLILKYLENGSINPDSAVYAKIWLAEAYRQKREYIKGIDVIHKLLADSNIGLRNRAFAMNRIAALYAELPSFDGNKDDSLIKYTGLCIRLSEENRYIDYLAASQNELGYFCLHQGNYDSALSLILKATDNFLLIKKYPQAINTYINLSRIYNRTGRPEMGKNMLLKALELGDIKNSRNFFKYIYLSLADYNIGAGNYSNAVEYLKIAYNLTVQFYDDRIQRQINEMSAKYDLREKEIKIREEEQMNKTYRLQKNYLLVIALISILALVVAFILLRHKSRAYKQLVSQNLKLLKIEKQFELNILEMSEENLVTDHKDHEEFSELGLRVLKFMAEEKPFLWAEASLDEFCKKLNTNRTYLSKVINDEFNQSFTDFICEYRIRVSRDLLASHKHKHLSVEGIGQMSGFRSNSTFHKKFKSVVGITPNDFRDKALRTTHHTVFPDTTDKIC
jgi:AraC-like DNA-binding protein